MWILIYWYKNCWTYFQRAWWISVSAVPIEMTDCLTWLYPDCGKGANSWWIRQSNNRTLTHGIQVWSRSYREPVETFAILLSWTTTYCCYHDNCPSNYYHRSALKRTSLCRVVKVEMRLLPLLVLELLVRLLNRLQRCPAIMESFRCDSVWVAHIFASSDIGRGISIFACMHTFLACTCANVHAFFVSCACACKEEIIIAMTKVSKQQHKKSTCHSKRNTTIFFEGKTATTKMNALLILFILQTPWLGLLN